MPPRSPAKTVCGRSSPVYQSIADVVGDTPILGAFFGGPASGRSFMTAGLILAIMVLPFITSISRDVFEAVPAVLKEAAYGMPRTWGVSLARRFCSASWLTSVSPPAPR